MFIRRFALAALSVGLVIPGTGPVSGQNYPTKPIRMVTAEAGGSTDLTARLIARGISGSLGQPIIVDNRGGGGGVIAGETVAKAPADGYTVLFSASALWIAPLLQEKTPYNPLKDFAPITFATRSPMVIVVHPSVAASSVSELIALAKAKPNMLNYGSGNTGSSSHLGVELFKSMTNVSMVRVPYKGLGPAINDLIANQVQVMFPTATSVASHVKSGRLRALAVTSAQPSALAPGLPTVAASGLPGYEMISTLGMFAPAKTATALVDRLNKEMVNFLNRTDVKEKFLSIGVEPVGSSPEELLTKMKLEIGRVGKIIKDAGIKGD